MLGDQRSLDAFLDALDPNDGNKRHHLLFFNEKVVFVGFREEKFRFVRDIHTGCFGQHR